MNAIAPNLSRKERNRRIDALKAAYWRTSDKNERYRIADEVERIAGYHPETGVALQTVTGLRIPRPPEERV